MDHIILEGFIGSGKATVGKKIAKDMALKLYEVEKMVSEKMKLSTADIHDKFGESYLRALETSVLNDLLLLDERAVIIIGSDLPLMPFNAPYLEKLGRVYWLKASQSKIVAKIAKTKKYAWMQKDGRETRVGDMLAEREPAYEKIAAPVIDMETLSADEAAEVIEKLAVEG